jgi:outer membrane protein
LGKSPFMADAFGVARSELYPTLVAVALSQTSRQQAFLNSSFYRQVVQSSDLAFDLNHTIFDFGGRSGRIDQAEARLIASEFSFNDTHRSVIYKIETAYYLLLNAIGQQEAARAKFGKRERSTTSSLISLKNGLATLPDVLEAMGAVAEAAYNVQAAIGAKIGLAEILQLRWGHPRCSRYQCSRLIRSQLPKGSSRLSTRTSIVRYNSVLTC